MFLENIVVLFLLTQYSMAVARVRYVVGFLSSGKSPVIHVVDGLTFAVEEEIKFSLICITGELFVFARSEYETHYHSDHHHDSSAEIFNVCHNINFFNVF